MRQAARAAVVLLLVLGAGCMESRAPAPVTVAPAAGGPPSPPPRLEMVGCEASLLEYLTEGSRLQPFLPAGYEARPRLGPLVGVAITLYSCRSAVLDGDRVVEDLRWLQVHASVRAPAAVASNGTSDQFLFELLVSDPSVQALLAEEGVNASLGQADAVRQGPATTIRAFRDGALLYEYEGSGEVGESAVDYAETLRYHTAPEAVGGPGFFDATLVGTVSSYKSQETGTLSAHGGFVAQTLEPGGATATGRNAAAGTLLLDFPSAPPSAASATMTSSMTASPSIPALALGSR